MKILIVSCFVFCFVFIPLTFASIYPLFDKIRHHQGHLETVNLSKSYSNSIKREQETIFQEPLDYHTFIRDFALFANDTNGKIQGKIIDELRKIPSNFKNLRKPIILSTDGYSFPKPTIEFHSNQGDVLIFNNVTLSQWYDNENDRKRFSALVGCDSSTKSKIRIELPFNLQIEANLSVTHPTIGSTNEGSIKLVIRNGSILKQITTLEDGDIEETFHRISFTNSKIDIQSNAAPQIVFDTNLGPFFNEIELSLRQFFANRLNEEINKRNVQLIAICSKTRSNPDDQNQAIEIHPFSLRVRNIFNLYIIPSSRTDTWKGISLDLGPIVISGFLNFNSSELSISREYNSKENRFEKRLSSRIKITNLKGKFDCNFDYNNITGNSSILFSFSSDHILIDNNYLFVDDWQASWNQEIKVKVGKTQIIRKPSKFTSNGYEMLFMDYVLSEYLKSVIAESLETSLREKFRDTEFSFLEPFFKDE